MSRKSKNFCSRLEILLPHALITKTKRNFQLKIFSGDSIVESIWEITKKGYPEWEGPSSLYDGITDDEKNEDVNYFEKYNGKLLT